MPFKQIKTEVVYKTHITKSQLKILDFCQEQLDYLKSVIAYDRPVTQVEMQNCATAETNVREELEKFYSIMINFDNIEK